MTLWHCRGCLKMCWMTLRVIYISVNIINEQQKMLTELKALVLTLAYVNEKIKKRAENEFLKWILMKANICLVDVFKIISSFYGLGPSHPFHIVAVYVSVCVAIHLWSRYINWNIKPFIFGKMILKWSLYRNFIALKIYEPMLTLSGS